MPIIATATINSTKLKPAFVRTTSLFLAKNKTFPREHHRRFFFHFSYVAKTPKLQLSACNIAGEREDGALPHTPHNFLKKVGTET